MIRMVYHDGRQVRITRLPRWLSALVLAGAMLTGFLLLALAAGLALVVVPMIVIGAGLSAWFIRRRPLPAGTASDPNVIDAEYRVLDHGEHR